MRDLIGGGPFGLKPGEWIDDTGMALAQASLKQLELALHLLGIETPERM